MCQIVSCTFSIFFGSHSEWLTKESTFFESLTMLPGTQEGN